MSLRDDPGYGYVLRKAAREGYVIRRCRSLAHAMKDAGLVIYEPHSDSFILTDAGRVEWERGPGEEKADAQEA